ncbi:MAG: GLPGLI family protein [Niabella sp.]|nr:MAG: GLPGLI family protein [Niabella sp.]
MKKTYLLLILIILAVQFSFAQKKLSEATIYYDVVINTKNKKPEVTDMLDGSTNIIYLKGNFSRSDFISSLGTQSTILDSKTGDAINIRDYGNKKFIIKYTAAEWKAQNRKYDNITYKIENEFKKIAGYNCQKAIGKLIDGSSFVVYFTKELIPVNTDFQYISKNLPGLVMQYDAVRGEDKITFTVSNIELSVVPLSKFDIPKAGYRIMSYSEFLKESSNK